MPSLLESFSIVYLEAMHHGLPIFTSDLWFARGVCGNAATYFDPFDEEDIVNKVTEIMSQKTKREKSVKAGFEKLGSFPSWQENFNTYQNLILELSDK